MQPEQVIREHLKLCERTHELLLRENKHLKDQGTPTSNELIEEKKQLLPLLDHSVTALNKLRREDFSPFGEDNEEEAMEYGFPSWWTANIKGGVEVFKFCEIMMAVENLFNQFYKPYASGVSSPGRNFILTARFKM